MRIFQHGTGALPNKQGPLEDLWMKPVKGSGTQQMPRVSAEGFIIL